MALHSSNNTTILIHDPVGIPSPDLSDPATFERYGLLCKHCKDAHLPRAGSNFRLGTLSEYRAQENRYIRDAEEGIFRATISFPTTTEITTDWLDRVCFGTFAIREGSFERNVITSVFVGQKTIGPIYSTDNVTIANLRGRKALLSGNIDLHFEAADAFLLCLSTGAEIGSVITDPEYNAVWNILQGNVWEFSKRVACEILGRLASGDFLLPETVGLFTGPGFSRPPAPTADGRFVQGVVFDIADVTYRSRQIEVLEQSEQVVEEVFSLLDQSSTIKPLDFSSEREVRIIFRPAVIDSASGLRYFFPNYLCPILLPTNNLLELVSAP